MDICITKPVVGGVVAAVPSKSFAHRLLICAALADRGAFIECGATSEDIEATARCLTALGARVSYDGSGYNVMPVNLPETRDAVTLDCGESGSTLRFLLPVCGALGVSAEFVMRGRLHERPVAPLLEQLVSHCCEVSRNEGSISVRGRLGNGVYRLPGGVSSQFVSGLLFALPLLGGDSEIYIEGREESVPYIDMTLDTIRSFGVRVERGDGRYMIYGGQKYCSPGRLGVEGDWSNAAFWLCAGAIGGGAIDKVGSRTVQGGGVDRRRGVTCSGLNMRSGQGDMALLSLLERFGAAVSYDGGSVSVAPAGLRGLRIDAGDIPDLVPVLSVVAAAADGDTEIYNAERLRIKESDRLQAVTVVLRELGADMTELTDGLQIRGGKRLRGGTVSSFGDHRIVMMAAVASCLCEAPVVISGAEAVNKSYPGFFTDFESLGGEWRVEG